MPVILEKPLLVGDLDPSAGDGYPHAQLVAFHHNGLTMDVSIEYEFGTASGDYYQIWTKGKASPTKQTYVQGADVALIWAQMPNDGECVGAAIRRCTYEYLINSGELVGTVQDNPPLPPTSDSSAAEATATDATTAAAATSTVTTADATTAATTSDSTTTDATTAAATSTSTTADAATASTTDASTV